MHRKFIVIEARKQSSMLVVRFQPGGAEALFRQPADALTNAVFPLGDVLDGGIVIAEGPGARGGWRAARASRRPKRWLMEHARPETAIDPLIEHLTARLRRPAGLRIADLCSETGYSTRHVLAKFREAVGVTPKQYARIRRFQQLLGHSRRARTVRSRVRRRSAAGAGLVGAGRGAAVLRPVAPRERVSRVRRDDAGGLCRGVSRARELSADRVTATSDFSNTSARRPRHTQPTKRGILTCLQSIG